MPVVKMNPAQNAFPIDGEDSLRVVDEIVALGAVPAFHVGSDTPHTPIEGLARVAARHPDHPVVAVHMGGGGGHFVEAEPFYQKARVLGLEQANVFYVLSAKRDTHIESAILAYATAGEPWSRNLAAGSDAPYGNLPWSFGGFRALFDALASGTHPDPRAAALPIEEVRRDVLGRNLADLILRADRSVLAADAGERSKAVDARMGLA